MKIEESDFNSKKNNNPDINTIKQKENENNISGKDTFKEELLTFNELKKSLNKEMIIENNDYSQQVLYDLDENWNKEYIANILKNKDYGDNKKIEAFNRIMYKLSYKERINILNEYKNLFDINKYKNIQSKQKDVFISFLKDIISIKKEDEIKLIHSNYDFKIQSSNIPYLEGSEEYIYTNLINKAYETFITLSNYQMSKKYGTHNEGELISNILKYNENKPVFRSINIISNNKNENDEKEKIIAVKKKEKETKFNFSNFEYNRDLLEPILKKYCSEEFQQKYKEFVEYYPELTKDKRVKYIYEIVLEALFYYCVFLNEKKKSVFLEEYTEIFYESENEKKKILKKYDNLIKIKEEKGKDYIDFNLENTIRNKDYTVFISNKKFELNFYDYRFKSLIIELKRAKDIPEEEKEQFINNTLNNPIFWTLQKQIKFNRPYNDNCLNDLFIKEVNKMLKHKVLEKVFNKVKMFEDYRYPFLKEGFIDQVHNNIVFIKLPTKLILGLTLKQMGIIIINKGRHDDIINDLLDKNSKFILKLSECAFYKISIIHEINFHYFLVLLYSNKKIDILTTPEKVFKGEIKLKAQYDFGDKGEIALFGNRISILYIKGIIDIVSLNSWDKFQNEDLEKIKNSFVELNKELNKDDIKIEDLYNLNDFSKCLYEIINSEKEIEPFIQNIGVGNLYCSGKILNLEHDIIVFDGDFGKIIPRKFNFNKNIHN